MVNPIQVTLQLIVKKLDQILKILKLGRRSNDREEEEKLLNKNDIFSRPDNPEHAFMRKDKDKDKNKSISQDKFNTAMKNVMHWVNQDKDK
jgi:hypothetical protein